MQHAYTDKAARMKYASIHWYRLTGPFRRKKCQQAALSIDETKRKKCRECDTMLCSIDIGVNGDEGAAPGLSAHADFSSKRQPMSTRAALPRLALSKIGK